MKWKSSNFFLSIKFFLFHSVFHESNFIDSLPYLWVLLGKGHRGRSEQIDQMRPRVKVGGRLWERLVQAVVHAEVGLRPGLATERVDLRLQSVDHEVLAASGREATADLWGHVHVEVEDVGFVEWVDVLEGESVVY